MCTKIFNDSIYLSARGAANRTFIGWPLLSPPGPAGGGGGGEDMDKTLFCVIIWVWRGTRACDCGCGCGDCEISDEESD